MDTFRTHGALAAYLTMALAWFFIQGDVVKGVFMGFLLFGVYVFTLYAIYKKYTLDIALKELVWGMILYGLATYLTNRFSVQ
jgi:riboflavin transporter FmnP